MGLEWFREAGKTGVFNLFDKGRHLTYGGKIATVELCLEPTLPRARTAAELKSMLTRRARTARARALSTTPVPVARPFLPSRGPSRWGVATGATSEGEELQEPAGGGRSSPISPWSARSVQVLKVSVDDEGVEGGDVEVLSPFSPADGATQLSPTGRRRHVVFAGEEAAAAAGSGVVVAEEQGRSMALELPRVAVGEGEREEEREGEKVNHPRGDLKPPRSCRSEKSVVFVQDEEGGGDGSVRRRESAGERRVDDALEAPPTAERGQLRSALRVTCATIPREDAMGMEAAKDGWSEGGRHMEMGMGQENSAGGDEEGVGEANAAGVSPEGISLQHGMVSMSAGLAEAPPAEASASVAGHDHFAGHGRALWGVSRVEPEDLGEVSGEMVVETPVDGGWGFEARGSTDMPMGVLYEMGSWGKSLPFENPAMQVGSLPGSSLVRVSSSSPWSRGRPEYVAGREPTPCVSSNEQQAWICVELPPGVALYPTAYTLRHGLAGPGRALRHWELQVYACACARACACGWVGACVHGWVGVCVRVCLRSQALGATGVERWQAVGAAADACRRLGPAFCEAGEFGPHRGA